MIFIHCARNCETRQARELTVPSFPSLIAFAIGRQQSLVDRHLCQFAFERLARC